MRAYALLVRLYPADHPRDEMLGVLEENGRSWPREAPSLLLGAARARTGAGDPVGWRWLYAARAAALMLLIAGALAPVLDLHYGVQLRTDLTVATWICAGLAAAAVVAGVRLVAFGLAAAALVLSTLDEISPAAIAAYALAAALLVIPGRPRPVRNPLPILLAVAWSADYTAPAWVPPALLAVLLAWTLIDERVLLAVGLALPAGLITAAAEVGDVADARGLLIMAALRLGVPIVLIAVAGTIAHRRAPQAAVSRRTQSR
jgi:hypothetical protein